MLSLERFLRSGSPVRELSPLYNSRWGIEENAAGIHSRSGPKNELLESCKRNNRRTGATLKNEPFRVTQIGEIVTVHPNYGNSEGKSQVLSRSHLTVLVITIFYLIVTLKFNKKIL